MGCDDVRPFEARGTRGGARAALPAGWRRLGRRRRASSSTEGTSVPRTEQLARAKAITRRAGQPELADVGRFQAQETCSQPAASAGPGGELEPPRRARAKSVVIFGHVGLDGFEYISDSWAAAPARHTVRMKCWRLPGRQTPRGTATDLVQWLYESWRAASGRTGFGTGFRGRRRRDWWAPGPVKIGDARRWATLRRPARPRLRAHMRVAQGREMGARWSGSPRTNRFRVRHSMTMRGLPACGHHAARSDARTPAGPLAAAYEDAAWMT